MKIRIILLTIFMVLISYGFAFADSNSQYTWDYELDKLPKAQQEFLKDVVTALRTSDKKLGKSRLHSSILSNPECTDIWMDKITSSTIKEQYAVKTKPGKQPGSLYFSIRHQNIGNDSNRSFMKLENVVTENGKLVINMNCEATLKMIEDMKNIKEMESIHKCGIKINYSNGSSLKSSSRVVAEKPMEGADLYEFCKKDCDMNVKGNKKEMTSYQCYINDVEIEKTKEKRAWDMLHGKK